MSKSDTSRTNGALSNGPKTEEGKARSSQYSLKHGLASDKILVLSTEKQEDYDALLASFVRRFLPQDTCEMELVEEMAGARWRLRRIRSMETEIMETRMEEHQEFNKARGRKISSNQRRQGLAFKSLADTSQSLQMLTRYETRLQRTYERAFDNLKKLRAFPQPELVAESEPQTEPNPSSVIEFKPRLAVDRTNLSEPESTLPPVDFEPVEPVPQPVEVAS